MTAPAISFRALNDAVDVVTKVGDGLVTLEGLPGRERQRYRDAVDATFQILEESVGLLSNRLGDIRNQALDPAKPDDRSKLSNELRPLADYEAWHRLEGEVRLCSSLRVTRREMDGLRDRLSGRIALKDWDGFDQMVSALLAGESALANTLAGALYNLSATAPAAEASERGAMAALRAVDRTWRNLRDLRRRIMSKHIDVYEAI